MEKVKLPVTLASIALILTVLISLHQATTVKSAISTNVVISEIQLAGADADDEFVELYNPTSNAVDLAGWRLLRKSSAGASQNLVSSMSGMIPAHGYFLVAKSDYDDTVTPDLFYSASSSAMPANSSVLLYSDAAVTLIDKVGIGNAIDPESGSVATPSANGSVERKANSSSTIDSMVSGIDMLLGNGEDTDNNFSDFILRETSQPQNSQSALEPDPSPTPSPTASPSASPSTSPSATPSASPTPSPSTSPTPSPSPTVSPTPSPTTSPSPTASPSATPTPSASPTPSVSPSPSGNPFPTFPILRLSCSVQYHTIRMFFTEIQFPRVSCRLVRS